jgi:hypothetical protein
MLLCAGNLSFGRDANDANVVVREIKAAGKTRQEAIKNGLYEAVSQVRGVKVDTANYGLDFQTSAAGINTSDTRKQIDFDSVSISTEGSVATTKARGLIKTYEVLKEEKAGDLVEVTLKVWVYNYQPPLLNKKIRLAIMPIKPLKEQYYFGFLMPGSDISNQLSSKLQMLLNQTNKFSVLDRLNREDFQNEKQILLSDNASIEEKAKLGEVLGAEYILTGTISDAILTQINKTLDATGYETAEYRARFVLECSLVVSASRQVILSDIIDVTFTSEEVEKLVERDKYKYEDMKRVGDRIISIIAGKATDKIMDNLFPIRVAAVDAEKQIVTIDQGSDRLSKKMLLEIYQEGQDVLDPVSNEKLGKSTVKVGTISVEDIMPKFSYGRLVDGKISEISKGQICKKKEMDFENIGRKGTVDTNSVGGVRLPFDTKR